jgi:murein DD-endopeptidase MepM/ murein hydrolase activator NlpD
MNYKTKTSLILPFKGTLIVGNGGRSAKINNHYSSRSQRYAYDFMSVYFKNKGDKIEDYDAFGVEVIAPADGVISQVIDGSIDMQLGERDTSVYPGNMIIIDHGNGEWSVLSHFKHNSITVKEGDIVNQGDILGLCGNTGNTSEPHIHYHLQDNALLIRAKGLPAQFHTILVDGLLKERVEPIRYQKVSNPK